ncbi:MAG: Wzz/FepE/Etk N-terminal domain-containing protein [Desulforegulaceae bacterium]|nr:Wzz/FepE/Etk N-terminal domain-containing protein [Desulforegulaceae bacterium]
MPDLNSPNEIKPEQIFDALFRYKWIIISFIAASLTLGLIKTFLTTRIYEASTLILVQPQKVPQNFVRSVVSIGIEARISTISQQIMSRSNLEKIIQEFGLFAENKDMYLEDKITILRNKIDVNITKAKQGSEAFTIKYRGSDPDRVMRITNTLAGYFMDENLKFREAQAVGTSEFLDVELEKTRERLEFMEKRLTEYRTKHMGGLPGELDSNLRTLDRLQKQHEAKNVSLIELKKEISSLKSQMDSQKSIVIPSFDFEGNYVSADEENLAKMKETMDILLLKYTDKHPDVLKLAARVEKLKKKIEDEKAKKRAKDLSSEESDEKHLFGDDFGLSSLRDRINENEKQIKILESEIKDIEKKMQIYQKRVEDTPKREQEIQALQRDYTNINGIYNSLLDRKLEAEISVNMEKKQKGEQFRILDHARIPQKPISPDVKKIFILFFGAGLVLSGGLSFIIFLFDSRIRTNREIEKDFGLNILAEIAPIKKPGDELRKKLALTGFVFLSLYILGIISCFFVLNFYGIDKTINLIKFYI